jgi:hypothetical protein
VIPLAETRAHELEGVAREEFNGCVVHAISRTSQPVV